MGKSNVRVVIPRNADEFLILINDIIAKETALAPNGTLSPADLAKLTTLKTAASSANDAMKAAKKLAEEKTAERDLAFGRAKGQGVDTPDTCDFLVTQLRDMLLAANKTNPKKLGEWGFVVNDSPAPKKKTEPKP